MYLKELHQPGDPGATYIYAHARSGMFLPLLEESRINGGRRLLGMLVNVYTSDDRVFLYEITEVRPHITSLDDAMTEQSETLWLQTSEGHGIPQKLQVIASPLSSGPADQEAVHPKPEPIACQ
jgi:hypothetical protein